MKNSPPFFEELPWAAVRDSVIAVSPDFADIVDEISPDDDCNFIRVRYPFGAKIVTDGLLNLLTERGDVRPITDTRLPKHIREKLDYSLVPLGLVTQHSIEVYRELEDRVFSIAAWAKGLDIGIWEHFGWTTPYSITAGARSLYMVPRVTLTSAHKKLKRDFNVTLPPPKRACEHWRLLQQIANSPNFSSEWYCEVVFLTRPWIDKLRQYEKDKQSSWGRLHNFLINKNLEHSVYGRRRSIFEIVWELFARSLNNKGLRPNPYVIDTLKHLAFVGTGGSPGSKPCAGQVDMGPIPDLQMAYLSSYGLKDYVPTIMQPQYLTTEQTDPVYYSLQSPSLLESVPKSRNLTSIVDNVRELMELSQHFLGEAFDEHLKIANISINQLISQLQFEFFHESTYAYGKDIRPTTEMPNNDPALLYLPCELADRKFADTSAYLHGCVRISMRKDDNQL